MRINGFEQIKAFYSWVFNNPDKVRPTHISLYLFLWNQGNRANWVEWFKCPYDLAMQGACIGNKGTYYKCLDDLQNFKLIKYKKGLNNYKAPQINLIQLYDSVPLSEQVTVPLSEPQTVPLTEQLPVHIYKLLTDNKQLVIDNLEKWINLSSINNEENNLYFSDEKIFLEWFNKCREYLKLPSNIKSMSFSCKNSFSELKKVYTKDEFKTAFNGFSKNAYFRENNMLFPIHFLKEENFTKFLNYKELTLAEKLAGKC